MALVAAIPFVKLTVMIAIVVAVSVFPAAAIIVASACLAVVLLVALCLPVSMSMFLITTFMIMVSESCVLPQTQKQSHAPNQKPFFTKHISPDSAPIKCESPH